MLFLEINTTLYTLCYNPFLNPVCTESNDFGNLFNRNFRSFEPPCILSLASRPSRIASFLRSSIAYTFLSLLLFFDLPCISLAARAFFIRAGKQRQILVSVLHLFLMS